MSHRAYATFAAFACLAACPPSPGPPVAPSPPDDPALRLRIARAEAVRADGVPVLVELARSGSAAARALALRGLGRIGGGPALAVLTAALHDRDPAIVAAAASAIGLLGALDEGVAADRAATTRTLLAALDRVRAPAALDVITAIGRAGEVDAAPRLVAGLAGPAEVAAASAIALGRYGRRKLAIPTAARDALAAALRHEDPRVRAAAIWALSREHAGELDDTARRELAAAILPLVRDPEPEIRATAIATIGRRALHAHVEHGPLVTALRDPDWRVATEAARVLGEHGDARAVADALASWLPGLEREPAGAHVVLEGLRALAKRDATAGAPVLARLARAVRTSTTLPALTRGWIDCLAAIALAPRALQLSCALPDHLRLPLVGERLAAGAGDAEQRRAAVSALLAHDDPRVRAAGLRAIPPVWAELPEREQRAALATVIASLDPSVKEPVVAGSAVEAAGALLEQLDAAAAPRAELVAAVVGRAGVEQDPELAGALLGVIGERAIVAGAAACRAGLAGAPVRARAAASCLAALGEPPPAPAVGAASPPPVDVAAVIGRSPRWRLVTTRGELVIALDPDAAPWAVATIVALTRKGFYDGLEVHRVVGNFVVQGGDPTESGWGGPGFVLPAEPTAGAHYVKGGVGMADAGRDSAGSQWFVMHAAAPHLDGRYTWIGRVERGQDIADALLIGDRVVRAVIE